MSDLIKRREAIKKTSLILGVGTLAPSLVSGILSGCKADKHREWTPQALSEANLSLVKAWIDIIIPETDTPSATQLLVHRFIDAMIEEFLIQEDINMIEGGLKQLSDQDFGKATGQQKIKMVSEMSNDDRWRPFFLLMKSMTLLGYFTTEIGATEVLSYDPVPGNYEGCIPIEKYGGKVWAT